MDKLGLYGLEVFHLFYYGINLFVAIGEIDKDSAYIYELETFSDGDWDNIKWDYQKGDYVTKGRLGRYILSPKDENSFFSKAVKIKPIKSKGKFFIPLEINEDSLIYKSALALNNYEEYLETGTFYLKEVCDSTTKGKEKILATKFKRRIANWETETPQA